MMMRCWTKVPREWTPKECEPKSWSGDERTASRTMRRTALMVMRMVVSNDPVLGIRYGFDCMTVEYGFQIEGESAGSRTSRGLLPILWLHVRISFSVKKRRGKESWSDYLVFPERPLCLFRDGHDWQPHWTIAAPYLVNNRLHVLVYTLLAPEPKRHW